MRKAGDIVAALFREKFGPDFMETARTSASLFSSWEQIAAEVWPRTIDQGKGDIPAAAVHSRIRELERGVLLVEADHPGWIQMLQTKQADLLSAVQRRYPDLEIRGIAFRLSREPPTAWGNAQSEEKESPDSDGAKDNAQAEERETVYIRPVQGDAPYDGEFYAALKGLEESIKKRNGL